MSFAGKWIEMEVIVLSLTKSHLFFFICGMWGEKRHEYKIETGIWKEDGDIRQSSSMRVWSKYICIYEAVTVESLILYNRYILMKDVKISLNTPWAECYHKRRIQE